jgi:co-chaperonin GroES (HSP10)
MKLQPARGYLFVIPVDDIPASKSGVGFGGKTEKQKPEQPYKLRVAAVGGSRPYESIMIESEVKVGDIISHNSTNATLREQREQAGFLVDGVWYLPMDFRDVLGIWEDTEERYRALEIEAEDFFRKA